MVRNYTFRMLMAACLGFAVLVPCVRANNVAVSSITATTTDITFNISWDNSWRVAVSPFNYDAVWVFVKYKDCSTSDWSHMQLAAAGHTSPATLDVVPSSDRVGAFVQRSASNPGTGSIASSSIKLVFNAALASTNYDFKVMAVEMVYVPQGAFYVGDAASTNTLINQKISSENSLGAGALFVGSPVVPAAYPKGYNPFYCMKYELSQAQYVEFLNSITPIQAGFRYHNSFVTPPSGNNNVIGNWPNYTTSTPHRPYNYLSWPDLLAYLDWSGLRPMTELEYEKACRGPVPSVANDFPWGTSTAAGVTQVTAISGSGATETSTPAVPTSGTGLAVFNGALFPLRSGFSLTATSNRLTGGASYYGIAEMAGNAWEVTVISTAAPGVNFDNSSGDGALTTNGDANVATWSLLSTAIMNKGGSYASAVAQLYISDRNYTTGGLTANPFQGVNRHVQVGGRGVRNP